MEPKQTTRKLCDIIFELSTISESTEMSGRSDNWRLGQAENFIQDVIGNLEEEIYD